MKRLTLILLAVLTLGWQNQLQARLSLGEWQAFMAYDKASTCTYFNGKVYAISEGSLFSYNPEDEDIQTFDIVYPMSDVGITHLALCPTEKVLIIVYENGNIDLMNEQEEVYNITDLKNSSVTDKTVNNVNVEGEKAYLATNFGIVVLDIDKRVISSTYTLNKKIVSTAVKGEYLIAATTPGDGLYYGKLTDNLMEKGKWTRMMTNTFTLLETVKGTTYACIPGYALLTIDPSKNSYEVIIKDNVTFLDEVNGQLLAGNSDGKLYLFDSPKTYKQIAIPKGMSDICYGNSTYWIAGTKEKLSGYKLTDKQAELTTSPIELNAPKRNLFYQMFMLNGKLYTCGGGLFLAPYYNPGTIQVMDTDGDWQIYQEEGIKQTTGVRNYHDIASIAVDPFDENHLFAASSGYGVYEFQDGKYVNLYTPENSTVSHDYRYESVIYPNGVKYDAEGNLWVLCAGGTDAIAIYTRDKRWISLHYDNFSQKETLRGTFFDSRGWMWAVTPHQFYNGVFMLNTNGTLEDTSDDNSLFMDRFYNQDGTHLDYAVHCAIEDKEGTIWLGTTNGPWLISNPTQLMAAQKNTVTVTQVKVPRNDGTNLADFLLEGVTIYSIAIDGANRKWIGTEKNGAYLLSADGLEAIHHFTTENSPLPSNEVRSITTDESTGMVYIGTSKGLVAYQGDATQAQSSFNESNVRAYPNPVRPDYQGYIRIEGLMMNSQVKITDSYGSLICEGTSVGGSFSWNGHNTKGQRVASGIYHVFATDEEGKKGIVTKISVIR